MKESKVTPKGQIVIPKRLREELGIRIGDKVLIEKMGGKILLVPKPRDPLKFMFKIAEGLKLGNMRREIREFRREVKE